MDLLERLQKYKYDSDDTYKKIATECGIPFSSFYNFTSGVRGLRDKFADMLNEFLISKGY